MRRHIILLGWYFLLVTGFGGYVQGTAATLVGPFDNQGDCERVRAEVTTRYEKTHGCWYGTEAR